MTNREIGKLETPLDELIRTYRSVMKVCTWPQAMLVNNVILETKRRLLKDFSTPTIPGGLAMSEPLQDCKKCANTPGPKPACRESAECPFQGIQKLYDDKMKPGSGWTSVIQK